MNKSELLYSCMNDAVMNKSELLYSCMNEVVMNKSELCIFSVGGGKELHCEKECPSIVN